MVPLLTRSDRSFVYIEGEQRWVTGWSILPADLSGDGVSELLLHRADGLWFVVEFAANGTQYRSGTWTPGLLPQRADLNGDNRADLMLYDATSGRWATAVTNAYRSWTWSSGTWLAGWQWSVTDLDGDGRSDVLLYHPVQRLWAKAVTTTPGAFGYVIGNAPGGLSMVGGHVVLP